VDGQLLTKTALSVQFAIRNRLSVISARSSLQKLLPPLLSQPLHHLNDAPSSSSKPLSTSLACLRPTPTSALAPTKSRSSSTLSSPKLQTQSSPITKASPSTPLHQKAKARPRPSPPKLSRGRTTASPMMNAAFYWRSIS